MSIAIGALVLAVLSFIASGLSVGWQIASWMMDGRRVRVSLLHGASGPVGSAVGKVGRNRRPRNLASVRAEGFTGNEVVGIAVTNIGRAPLRVDRYGVRLVKGGFSFYPIGEAVGPTLPFRLPPGETETWYANVDDARALVASARAIGHKVPAEIRMEIELGTGDWKRTRRSLLIG
jgi:hypothetical protein